MSEQTWVRYVGGRFVVTRANRVRREPVGDRTRDLTLIERILWQLFKRRPNW